MAHPNDPYELKVGSTIGFRPEFNHNNSNRSNREDVISLGIIDGNIDFNNCDIKDLDNDKIHLCIV